MTTINLPEFHDVTVLESMAKTIRRETIQLIYQAKGGHLGGSLSQVEILVALYFGGLLKEQDHFILSKSHSCESLYYVLQHKGFLTQEILDTYGKDGSSLSSHAHADIPGIEYSGGSLGHGLPFGVGMAFAAKLQNTRSKIFVLVGDGEMVEGSNWEALEFARKLQLNNFYCLIDCNNEWTLGKIEQDKSAHVRRLMEKTIAFGCITASCDGHNFQEIFHAFNLVSQIEKPKTIVFNTIKGRGSTITESGSWHHKVPNKEQFEKIMKELDQ